MRPIASLVSMSMLLMPSVALSGQGFDVIVLGALGGIQDGNLAPISLATRGPQRRRV